MSHVLLGGVIGDSLGSPFEFYGKDPPTAKFEDWDGETYLPNKRNNIDTPPGQGSDDTDMLIMVSESLIENKGFNPDDMSARYVDWVLNRKPVGIGGTLLKAINNLNEGAHWSESGIPGSFGNGSAMRAAPFGVYFRNDIKLLIESVKIDSAITHKSIEAESGALAIALSIAYASNNENFYREDLLDFVIDKLPDSKIKRSLSSLDKLFDNLPCQDALNIIGTEFDVKETVPAVLFCYLNDEGGEFYDYSRSYRNIIAHSGDTDTNCSILLSLYGAQKNCPFTYYHVKNVFNSEKIIDLDKKLFEG